MRTFCLALLTGLALTGCDEDQSIFSTDYFEGGPAAEDADGDGYTAGEDCDDDSFSVNPGAAEICDGIDNDCDGKTDDGDDTLSGEGRETYYADMDGDGYGSEVGGMVLACNQPGDFVPLDGDCNDYIASINPAAEELCDGLDNDCDGMTDDADDSLELETAREFFVDEDGDGFGRSGEVKLACAQPEGFAAVDGDCADLDSNSHPGATEICDGVDNDCDSRTDDADDDLSDSSKVTFYADSDEDGFGDDASTTRACEAPEGFRSEAGDCNDGDAAVSPSALEVCDSIDNDCDGMTDDEDTLADSAERGTFYADADGDGFGDASAAAQACAAAAGHVADSTDCNDNDDAVSPSAEEICDSIDNDCDGMTDDEDDSRITDAIFFADSDGDGFGDASAAAQTCAAAPGHVADSTDCDDDDAAVSPSAEEICDSIDNDCDGMTDDSDGDLTDGIVFYRDFDEDGYGHDTFNITACQAPERYTETSGDCDDDDDSTFPGAMEQCDGVDNDCDEVVDQAWIDEDFEHGAATSLTQSGDLTWESDDAGSYIMLTSAQSTDESSAIFFEERVPGSAWSISAVVSMDDGDGNDAGTGGITLAFLSESDSSVLGDDLGVGGLSGYAIELDIDADAGDDPDGNHLALIETGSMTHLSTVTGISALEGAGEMRVEVTYDDQLLEVYLDDVLMMSEELDSEIGSEVLLGITAGTGDTGATQTLDELVISCP
jgi:hypothetical protein